MKKTIILRGALGFPIGLAICYLISIFTSYVWAKGYYVPCEPELVSAMGNEINAVIFQALLSGILGIGFSASSVIWKMEEWSSVKQTGIYFAIVSVIMLPISYFTYWMEHSIAGLLSYIVIFVFIFVIIWIVEFAIWKHNVNKMNENLYKTKDDKSM